MEWFQAEAIRRKCECRSIILKNIKIDLLDKIYSTRSTPSIQLRVAKFDVQLKSVHLFQQDYRNLFSQSCLRSKTIFQASYPCHSNLDKIYIFWKNIGILSLQLHPLLIAVIYLEFIRLHCEVNKNGKPIPSYQVYGLLLDIK